MFSALYLLTINAAAFLLMHNDKRRAKKKAWRIPEAVLLLSAALGGAVGSWLGMYTFHHKTRKPKFYITVPVLVFVQVFLIYRYL